jgi:hypothetical protein
MVLSVEWNLHEVFFVEAKCGRQIGVSGAPLVRPADGDIDSTVANDAEGARLIVDISARLATPARPVVVVAGGRLTDVADAYLLDRDVSNPGSR